MRLPRRRFGLLESRHGARADRRVSGAFTGWLLFCITLLCSGALACVQPEPTPFNLGRSAPLAKEAGYSLGPGQLRVRLARQEEKLELRVNGTASGSLGFSAEGNRIRCTNGEVRTVFQLEAKPGTNGLELDGRFYYGTLSIQLHGGQGLRVENLVELEDYIAGVVPSELILWSAEESEIEAQAIAARTYALRSIDERSRAVHDVFLWDDTRDQVYLGNFQAGSSGAAQRVEARFQRGLRSSRGRVVVDDQGKLRDVRFHASCGGYTCSPAEAFPGESQWRYDPVPCAPCQKIGEEERSLDPEDPRRRRVHWSWTADAPSLASLAHQLGLGERILALHEPGRGRHGRWQSIEVQGDRTRERISIERLRRELGPARLKGSWILRTWPAPGQPITAGLYFEGIGRGHGAGLCQVGSHEYARQGWSARQILQHYLPGARIAALPSE